MWSVVRKLVDLSLNLPVALICKIVNFKNESVHNVGCIIYRNKWRLKNFKLIAYEYKYDLCFELAINLFQLKFIIQLY